MKKQICLISLTNLFLVPYLGRYFSTSNCEYEVIFWDRLGIEEDSGIARQTKYTQILKSTASMPEKLLGYIRFAMFCRRALSKRAFDRVILTTTNAGMMLLDVLVRRYRGRYLVDIRDYTLENNTLFLMLEKLLLRSSGLNVVSSDGYKSFLPTGNYVLVHNDPLIPAETIQAFRARSKPSSQKIVLTNIGFIRFHEQNRRIIDFFLNDPRYELRFIGEGAQELEDYCRMTNANNVKLIGRFDPKDTHALLLETDMILNLYGNKSPLLDFALSNKLYIAAKLGVPILVSPGTHMDHVSALYGLGRSIALESKTEVEELLDFYLSMNWQQFYAGCDRFLSLVESDMAKFRESVSAFVNEV